MKTLRLRGTALNWVTTDTQAVVLDSESEQYLATNSTGALLWSALAEGATRPDLVALICQEFDGVDEQRASEDVDEFVGRLRELNLVEET